MVHSLFRGEFRPLIRNDHLGLSRNHLESYSRSGLPSEIIRIINCLVGTRIYHIACDSWDSFPPNTSSTNEWHNVLLLSSYLSVEGLKMEPRQASSPFSLFPILSRQNFPTEKAAKAVQSSHRPFQSFPLQTRRPNLPKNYLRQLGHLPNEDPPLSAPFPQRVWLCRDRYYLRYIYHRIRALSTEKSGGNPGCYGVET